MVKQKTVEGWGFACLGFETNEYGEVTKMFCKTCREFYSSNNEQNKLSAKFKGSGKFLEQSNAYVNGTRVIKKTNFEKHLNFENHRNATLRLREKDLMSAAAQSSSSEDTESQTTSSSCSGTPKQALLRPMLQKMNAAQRQQLGRKFQLAHFTSSNAKSFKAYADFAAFEKKYHNVDLGAGYMTDKAGAEIVKYISISQRMTNITEPLNNDVLHYYSVLFDGASSAKCVDEKELFVIKTCVEGQPTFNVMSLEEPEECNAQGIKDAMENSISKMNFNFERKDKEIGICSDGASVNRAVYNLLAEEFGDHYLLMLCPSHKFQLAINDAFGSSLLNNRTEKDYTEVYSLFKKAPLRWRLFKRQSLFMGIPLKRYKRLTGTRWVEHRLAALDSHLDNLPILIGFCDQQIRAPHNDTIKKLVPTLEGIRKSVANTTSLIFNAAKLDILAILRPMSMILQDTTLLSPQFLTTCQMTVDNVNRMHTLLNDEGGECDILKDEELFPRTVKIFASLEEENAEIVPERRTRKEAAANRRKSHSLFHGYLMSGNIDDSLKEVINKLTEILDQLAESLIQRYGPIVQDEFFTATAKFLETDSYSHTEFEELFENVVIIKDRYNSLLSANGCDLNRLKAEFRMLYTHVNKFLSKCSPDQCWLQLFKLKHGLGLRNILHVAELCIAIPLSNAESERVFSYLWRQLSKERMSLNHETLEQILQLRCSTQDYSLESYDNAIDLFLTEYPDGTVRKQGRHLDGHAYPAKRKKRNDGNSVTIPHPSLERINELLREGASIEKIDPNLIPLSVFESESEGESETDDG